MTSFTDCFKRFVDGRSGVDISGDPQHPLRGPQVKVEGKRD